MLGNIFNVFSRRSKQEYVPKCKLTNEFRNRALMFVRDTTGASFTICLEELHKKLTYLHGKPRLSIDKEYIENLHDDALYFLLNICEDEHFLDSIEYMFEIDIQKYVNINEDEIINQINEFFDIDELPYYLTKSVWKKQGSDQKQGSDPRFL